MGYIWLPFVMTMAAGYTFMSLAPTANQFMALFGVGYAGLSVFISALLWAHTIIQLPAGLILDRLGVYKGFLIAVIIGVVSCLLPFVAADNLYLATVLRFCAGLSTGILFLAGLRMTTLLAPPDKLPQMQGMQGAAFSLGLMLPYVTLPYLGEKTWPFAYIIPAGLMAFLFVASLKMPAVVKKAPAKVSSNAKELVSAVKTVSFSIPIWTIGIFHGFSYGTINNLGQWLPSILADMDKDSTFSILSLGTAIVLLTSTLARAFASYLLKWCTRSFMTNITVLLIAVLYIALGLVGNPWIGLIVGVILAWLGGANFGSVFSLTGQNANPAYIATAVGFMNLVGNITSVLLTMILGFAREYTGSFSMSLCVAGVCAFIIWILGYRIILKMEKPQKN